MQPSGDHIYIFYTVLTRHPADRNACWHLPSATIVSSVPRIPKQGSVIRNKSDGEVPILFRRLYSSSASYPGNVCRLTFLRTAPGSPSQNGHPRTVCPHRTLWQISRSREKGRAATSLTIRRPNKKAGTRRPVRIECFSRKEMSPYFCKTFYYRSAICRSLHANFRRISPDCVTFYNDAGVKVWPMSLLRWVKDLELCPDKEHVKVG